MTQGSSLRFVLSALATWRLAHLVAAEDGPAEIVARARARAGATPLGELMDCLYCLSFWTAAPFAPALAPRRRDLPTAWLALSGAACLIERLTANDEKGAWDVLWEEPARGRRPDAPDTGEPGRRRDHEAETEEVA